MHFVLKFNSIFENLLKNIDLQFETVKRSRLHQASQRMFKGRPYQKL